MSLASLPACRERHAKRHAPGAADTPVAAPREGAHPPKPRAVANAAPPNLPRLKAQATAPRHVPPERKPGGRPLLEEYPCGSVWTGDEEVALECDQPVDEQKYGAPAVALIPYAQLRAPRGALPSTVDHRIDGFEGRVLDQGRAPSCTAFALASQVNHALGLWTGHPGDVSVMQVWARYHHPQGPSSIAANIGKTLARDADWPYDASTARGWASCKGEGSCISAAQRQRLDEVDRKGLVALEAVEHLPSDDTLFDVIAAKLAAGRDVGIAGKVPRSFRPVGDPGSRYVPDFTEYGNGGHAFTTVGYTHVGGERYFLLKNSWGERWGDRGYAWMHEQTLRRIVHGGYVVVVDPIGDVGLRRHRRNQAQVAACNTGEAPDSVDGACKPLCADGAPRHGGFCGATEDCTRGFVNVAGECVLAAPVARGTEAKTGITFACGPSGCLYTIPGNVEGCTSARCQKSCPAPDFRLGKGRGGLLCLE